ncbi:hypothetical protein B4N89_46190 [Embleya scabrispora]|uniref:Uncharacterized protein n=1 Tax=Embleya scabrispora TaxID=159449 RepID=A0A1T3NJI7_9ACTN|nr:hypothetical protein [Embleya scabrispora]OPC76865.1 hypothetical protein B4N89_46190 [Embleya scabrispora]
MIYPDENSADELQAIYEASLDVDMEMAEACAVGDRIAAIHKAGGCAHMSAQGYRPNLGDPDLGPGQLRCTASDACQRVFPSQQAWYDAMDQALED